MLPPMLKRQCNMKTNKRTVTDIGTKTNRETGKRSGRHRKVLFFASPHFLFFNFTTDAHLAHCLLPATAQSQTNGQKSKSQIFLHTTYVAHIQQRIIITFKSLFLQTKI
jgi:hypothetical protein